MSSSSAPGEIDGGWDDVETGDGGWNDSLAQRRRSADHVIDARLASRLVEAEPGARVALGIDVDDQHAAADGGEGGGEVDRGRCFADTALLVRDGDDPHDRGRVQECRLRSWVRDVTCLSRSGRCRADQIGSPPYGRQLSYIWERRSIPSQHVGPWGKGRRYDRRRRAAHAWSNVASGASARAVTTSAGHGIERFDPGAVNPHWRSRRPRDGVQEPALAGVALDEMDLARAHDRQHHAGEARRPSRGPPRPWRCSEPVRGAERSRACDGATGR